MFRPMALTAIFALAGSMILSMTLMPVLASYFLPRKIEERTPLFMRIAHAIHNPILDFSMHHKTAVIAIAVALLVFAFGFIAPNLGSEFVPTLSEGALTVNIIRLADTPIERSVEENTRIEKAILAAFPNEVNHIWSRIGTAEIATDPMGVELTDMYMSLKPRLQWTKAKTQGELTELLQKEIRPFLGPRFAFSQPIKLRLDEMISGVRSDLGIKLFGDDIKTLQTKAGEIEKVLKAIPGNADVSVEPLTGLPLLQIKVKQDELARHGIPGSEIMELVEALGGTQVSEVVQGQFRFPLVIRLPEKYRGTLSASDDAKRLLEELPIVTAKGERLPLSRLASVDVIEDSPSTITREWGQRRITITCNVRGRDLGSFVQEAEKKLRADVAMPSPRYHLELGGQYEHLISAQNRLMIVVPVALAMICGLLYVTYGKLIDMARSGGRHPCAVGSRYAILDLGRDWVHRDVRGGGARRYDFGLLYPPTQGKRNGARTGRARGRGDALAPGLDDDAGGEPRVGADGLQHGHGRRGATPAGYCCDRRCSELDGDVVVRGSSALLGVSIAHRSQRAE